MNFFNFKAVVPDDFTKPYIYEWNVQGISVNAGIQIRLNSVILEYCPNFRYDYTHDYINPEDTHLINIINGDSVFTNNKTYKVKEFIIDHNFNFIVKRKLEYGIGFSVINSGKGYYFVNPVLRYHNIEFKTYNVFVTVPIKKVIHLEIKALYVPEGFPYNPNEKYMMYSLRAYYRFGFLNRSRKHKSN